jgi:hypothetical protein
MVMLVEEEVAIVVKIVLDAIQTRKCSTPFISQAESHE